MSIGLVVAAALLLAAVLAHVSQRRHPSTVDDHAHPLAHGAGVVSGGTCGYSVRSARNGVWVNVLCGYTNNFARRDPDLPRRDIFRRGAVVEGCVVAKRCA